MIRKILLLAIAAFALAAPAQAASPYGTYPACVNPYDAYENQEWDIDTDEHIHTGVCFPVFADIPAPVEFDFRTLLHNNDGHMNFARVGVEHGGWGPDYFFRGDFAGNGLNEVGIVHSWVFDPARNAHSGFMEFRISSNVQDPAKGRWYTTARLTPNIVNGKSRDDYSGGPTTTGRCGGGGHYGEYDIAWIDCRDLARIRSGPIPSGFVVHLRFQNGQRGVATIDPGFHNGNPGSVQYDGPAVPVAVALNAAPGWHKLHIRSERAGDDENGNSGHFAGAFVIPFLVG